jgi:signal transduction histidine kinase
VPVTLIRDGVAAEWGPGAGLVVYRIVQEALTNTLKHAGSRASAEVRIRYDAGGAAVEVVDDGAGRTAECAEGHGLIGMRERAASCGGWLEAGPLTGPGWRVRAHLPFELGVAA